MFEQCSIEDTIQQLESNLENGLTETEAAQRLSRNGRNEMQEARKQSFLETFFEQLNDPLIYVLLVAAVVSVLLKEISDALIIAVVVILNAFVGVLQEGKAKRALDSLKKLASPKAVVLRDGKKREIAAAELVRGDIVYLEAGCQVPADLRLVESVHLKMEESALTGESVPIEKKAGFLGRKGEQLPLGDRLNMAYMSTIVTLGRGTGVVTATGMRTELGQIAALLTTKKEELTPLQKRLGELGKLLSLLSLLLCAALFGLAVFQHRNVGEMLITAISLAVAAVPEGLPAVVTICLALSVTRMVKVNTIVRRLPSVETLGAVSVVCSDKTGTLTQNRMAVEKIYLGGKTFLAEDFMKENQTKQQCPAFLEALALCNDVAAEQEKGEEKWRGDPTELALVELAQKAGVKKETLEKTRRRIGELPFDSDRKMMTTLHQGNISFTKGAPDEVWKRCSRIWTPAGCLPMSRLRREQLQKQAEEMSGEALRTLAVAMRTQTQTATEEDMIFLGLTGMRDPARPEAKGAVEKFQKAGVATVMITGDHVDTAFAIARQLGIVKQRRQCMTGEELQQLSEEELAERLPQTRVFARVSPLQKVQIVEGFQKKGEIVAMTGDGVNDAPSLKRADIGIAMGQNGTDVARQAADMVLTDDNFATIAKAVEEGRGVYENIRKSVIFLLSSNLGELITMFLAVLCGLASPLKSSHILWINLITDSLPALALGVDKNDGKSLMLQPPRKAQESLFSRGGFACTLFYGVLIGAISLTAFLMPPCTLLKIRELPLTLEQLSGILQDSAVLSKAQTYAFTVLGMSQLYHAVGMRDVQKSIFCRKPLENKLMIGACVLGFFLQFAVTEVPFLVQAFAVSPLSAREWLRLSFLAAAPLLAHEVIALTAWKSYSARH